METPEFAVGASVMLSDLGRRNSRSPEKRGMILGISRTGTAYRVRWTDRKTADFVHVTFLQACDARAPAAARAMPGVKRNAKPDASGVARPCPP